MSNLFDKLFDVASSADSLDKFLNENMQLINDFYNSNYSCIRLSKNSIENFVLLKYNVIEQLDYTKSYVKSFVSMLLDYCERFNFLSATPRVYTILVQNDILINSRLQAALEFLYPKPETNTELVDRFDSICEKLQLAIDTEEDNDEKAIATFLNYYGIIVNDTRLEFAKQVRSKIVFAIQNKTYNFFQNENISIIADIELHDLDLAYLEIQKVLDNVLSKKELSVYDFDLEKEKIETCEDSIIETDTDYSKEIFLVPTDFDSIRSISVGHADGRSITKRGVKILESEEELFEYMKRFGNMHKAKLQSAFEEHFPQKFSLKVNIIDWGCGQGIASMIFLEKYGYEIVKHITLIEPSEIAIGRAALHCKKYCNEITVKTICKKLDDLKVDDFHMPKCDITLHLFSNILDIDDYSQSHVIELIEKSCIAHNYFVCVSPYIDDIKTERLESFKRHFEKNYDSFKLLQDVANSKNNDFWCCNNTYTKGDIKHGHYFNCNEYTEDGCNNRWTRIIKVFEVNLIDNE